MYVAEMVGWSTTAGVGRGNSRVGSSCSACENDAGSPAGMTSGATGRGFMEGVEADPLSMAEPGSGRIRDPTFIYETRIS